MKQSYINHIAFVLDASSSMIDIAPEVVKIFDNQIQHLALRSKETDQETRVSVYQFAEKTSCLIFDKDCLRLPSIKDLYKVYGNTALIDATLKTLEDLEDTSVLYGDHSFLVFVLTDGQDNRSVNSANRLSEKLKSLPENWTVAVLAPDVASVSECKRCGFSQGNIQVWDTTSKKGTEEAGKTIQRVTDSYMAARATGVRGTKTLFQIDTSKLKSDVVTKKLDQLKENEYEILDVRKDGIAIQPFIESWKLPFRKGAAYYQLTKAESVQANKQVLVQNKLSGKIYTGTEARELLGLPNYEVKVTPSDFKNYNIYIQSTSTNRKLVAGTQLVYIK